MKWLLLLALIVGSALLFQRVDMSMISVLEDSEIMAVVVAGAFLAFVGLSALSAYQGRLGKALLDLMAWVAIAMSLVVGYSYRDDLSHLVYRVAGELMPPGRVMMSEERSETGERSVRIRRRGDGHFVARTEISGVGVNMMVDTGATTVVLRAVDAKAAGIDPRKLNYSVAVQTANGTAYAASIRIPALAIGPITVTHVDALVAQPGTLKESLLGMSFLRRLRSYEFSGDFLTFRG
jgi:aspartyl protease family protein